MGPYLSVMTTWGSSLICYRVFGVAVQFGETGPSIPKLLQNTGSHAKSSTQHFT